MAASGRCTPARWENPVTGTATLAPDLAQCTEAARTEVTSYGPEAYYGWGPGHRWPPRFELFEDPTYRAAYEWEQETQLRNFCMRVKGYQLVPGTVAAAP